MRLPGAGIDWRPAKGASLGCLLPSDDCVEPAAATCGSHDTDDACVSMPRLKDTSIGTHLPSGLVGHALLSMYIYMQTILRILHT